MKLIKLFISYLMFPITIASGIGLMLRGIEANLELEVLAMTIAITTIVIVHVAERIHPYRKQWNKGIGDTRADIISLGMILSVVEPFLKLFTAWSMSVLLIFVGEQNSISLFPNEWPLLGQLVLFAVLAEFGRYWMHRLSHTNPILWRFHAAHHSPKRLYQFNGFRIHPINLMWNYFAGQFWLVLIGAEAEVIMLYFVLSSIIFAFQHANIASKNGILNFIFSTNELHRWHHTTDKTVGYKNHGSVVIIWDQLFGSFYTGKNNKLGEVGLISPRNYPINNFFKQIVMPFCWKRCIAEGESENTKYD